MMENKPVKVKFYLACSPIYIVLKRFFMILGKNIHGTHNHQISRSCGSPDFKIGGISFSFYTEISFCLNPDYGKIDVTRSDISIN